MNDLKLKLMLAVVLIGLGKRSAVSAEPKDELLRPVKIMAGGTLIDADLGHAAPFFVDLDGNGVKHLLVGQFSDGKLAIYRNIGTNKEPKFDKKEWFEGRVPAS
jgi:hypothetical protein